MLNWILDRLSRLFPNHFAPRLHTETAEMLVEYAKDLSTAALIKHHIVDPVMERVTDDVAPERVFDGISPDMKIAITPHAYFFLVRLILSTCFARGIDDERVLNIVVYVLRFGLDRDESAAFHIALMGLKWCEQIMAERGENDAERAKDIPLGARDMELYDKASAAGRRLATAAGEDRKATWEEEECFFECCRLP